MARRNEDRLDTLSRVFDTIFSAHDAKLREAGKLVDGNYEHLRRCEGLLVELAHLVPRSSVSEDLERRLRPFLDIDDLPDIVF